MSKIVFILKGKTHPRCIKRIKEFIANRYEVDVYAFERVEGDEREIPYECNVIGRFSNETPYWKRLGYMRKCMAPVIRKHLNDDCVFYLFGLDTALVARTISHKFKYIYEESDLNHTYISVSVIKNFLESIDKKISKNSIMTVYTSEGFAIYHYGNKRPQNVFIIPNRLEKSVLDYPMLPSKPIDLNHLSIGFVGKIRFESIMAFAEHIVKNYPQHEFHFFGTPFYTAEKKCEELKAFSNCHFHGLFSSPKDLPQIYSKIDLVLSTYDLKYENVKYAEPNKLYESLYFETPIIVTEGTFLGEQVKKFNSGYTVNPLDNNSIDKFLSKLTIESINIKINSMKKIPKEFSINSNKEFFNKVASIVNSREYNDK